MIGDSTNCRNTEHQIIRNAQLTNQRNILKWVMRVMLKPQMVRNTGIRMDEKPNQPLTLCSDMRAPISPVLFSISWVPLRIALWSVPPVNRKDMYAMTKKMAIITRTAPLTNRNVSLRNVSYILLRLNLVSGFCVPVRVFVSLFLSPILLIAVIGHKVNNKRAKRVGYSGKRSNFATENLRLWNHQRHLTKIRSSS